MNYIKIDTEDVCNGDGLRVVLWLSGCSHHCYNCQNPQTWDANSGILFDESAKEELFKELNKDYISGLTLTGGDPLYEANLDGVLSLVNKIRLSLPEKTIWLYSGYKVEKIYNNKFILSPSAHDIANIEPDYIVVEESNKDRLRSEIISKCTVMVDGQYMDSKRDITLQWRGSSNQRVINVQQSIQKGEIVLWKS